MGAAVGFLAENEKRRRLSLGTFRSCSDERRVRKLSDTVNLS
jgi:hypothetical protein